MAGNAGNRNNESKKSGGINNNVQRGTQDELEIIGLIIGQNVGLRQIVLDRLRQARGRHETRQAVLKSRGGKDDKAG